MVAVTRAHLSEAVKRAVGLPYDETAKLVDSVLDMILQRLSAGEAVKLSSLGTFTVRRKSERIGRNLLGITWNTITAHVCRHCGRCAEHRRPDSAA